ncbi:MAG TPA: O-antigen ligase family protein [Acetobacteraceae bacterium]|nr:O-antigen ligase family protein [Acetobacteraceae bacterium]
MRVMATPLSTPWSAQADLRRPVLLAIGGAFTCATASAVLAPAWFWVPLAIVAITAAGILAFRHLVAVCVAWLLIAGATLEMTLADIVGPGAYQSAIAAVKTAEIGLALLCILRYGFRADLFNPALAFLAMFVAGLAHGLHHDLTPTDSLRSLLGSVAPFAFAFSRLSPGWGGAMVRATAWIPLLSVAGGTALDLAGLRPVFVDSFGQRLAGLGHPAFLAGFCLAAIYACLIELYRDGRFRWLLLLAVNFLILVLTGARAPLACAIAVTGLTFGFVRSSTVPRWYRILPLLLAGCLLPLLVVLARDLPMVRLFNVLSGEAANLSGRELLWPPFEQAAAASPWFGWGVGAGNAIIPQDSELAQMIRSWAAHNEYLRMSVEGGQLGRGLLIVLFVLWVWRNTRRLCRTDKAIMRLVFVAFAVHAYTDNVLIATTACVFFPFATGVFARSE